MSVVDRYSFYGNFASSGERRGVDGGDRVLDTAHLVLCTISMYW